MEVEVVCTREATLAFLLNVINDLRFRIMQSHGFMMNFWDVFSKCVFIIVHAHLFLQNTVFMHLS